MKIYDKISIAISYALLFISLFARHIIGDELYHSSINWIMLAFSLIFLGMIILRWVKEKELDKMSLIMFVFIFVFLIMITLFRRT